MNQSAHYDLPSVPAALASIIKVTTDPDATGDQVAKAVMLDQSLASKLLRLANSAYYNRGAKTETVTQAILALGYSQVRNLAASASLIDALFPRQMFPGFSWQNYWTHSVTCAIASSVFYSRSQGQGLRGSEVAFLAGMLHDVGKLILARIDPAAFLEVVKKCNELSMDMWDSEMQLLPQNHSKAGADMAKQWQFSDFLVKAILNHHNPEIAGAYQEISMAVAAGNALAKVMAPYYLSDYRPQITAETVAEIAGITVSDLNFIVVNVKDGLGRCSEILSWGSSMPGDG